MIHKLGINVNKVETAAGLAEGVTDGVGDTLGDTAGVELQYIISHPRASMTLIQISKSLSNGGGMFMVALGPVIVVTYVQEVPPELQTYTS